MIELINSIYNQFFFSIFKDKIKFTKTIIRAYLKSLFSKW